MILTIGSLNIDHVYRVRTIARPGETIHTLSYDQFSGGKGLNQSIAAARAGAQVQHAGCIGPEGLWLKTMLAHDGVDVSLIETGDVPTGHAIIQVSDTGENSIFIFGGANQSLTPEHLARCFRAAVRPSFLLLQNETNVVVDAIRMAVQHRIPVVYNPAPMDDIVARTYPLQDVALLIVNEVEGSILSGRNGAADILAAMAARFPDTDIILTLGAAGAVYRQAGAEPFAVAGHKVPVTDTTAAGDAFIGYCLAGLDQGQTAREALTLANQAAALCVTRPGAAPSIPYLEEVRHSNLQAASA